MTPPITEAVSPPIKYRPGTVGGLSAGTSGATTNVHGIVGAPAGAGFKVFEPPTQGAYHVVLSEQLERYIKAADVVLRPSNRIDRPLGVEPDDYPVR